MRRGRHDGGGYGTLRLMIMALSADRHSPAYRIRDTGECYTRYRARLNAPPSMLARSAPSQRKPNGQQPSPGADRWGTRPEAGSLTDGVRQIVRDGP